MNLESVMKRFEDVYSRRHLLIMHHTPDYRKALVSPSGISHPKLNEFFNLDPHQGSHRVFELPWHCALVVSQQRYYDHPQKDSIVITVYDVDDKVMEAAKAEAVKFGKELNIELFSLVKVRPNGQSLAPRTPFSGSYNGAAELSVVTSTRYF